MLDYKNFWENLKYAYPISKWDIRIPINYRLENLNININNIIQELYSITDELISYKDSIKSFIKNNWEDSIIDLLEWNFNGIIRFDWVVDKKNNFKIVEVNCDYPDWLLLHDYTFSVLSRNTTSRHLDNFIKLFDKNENIFIIYPENESFIDAYYQEYYSLKKQWFNAFIGNESDLEKRFNKLYFNNIKIDVIRRDMEVYKFNKKFLDKIYWTDIRFINSFDLRVLWYKSILNNIKNDYIPESFMINENNKSYILDNKDSFVVKPSNLSEWWDVYIWKDYDFSEWKKILYNFSLDNFIAQEFIDMKKINVDMYENEGIVNKDLYFDICPHFFIKNWKIVWDWIILMRFSENKVLNVFQGWWIWYYNY